MHKAHAAEWRKPHTPKRGTGRRSIHKQRRVPLWKLAVLSCCCAAALLDVVLQLLCDDRINTPS